MELTLVPITLREACAFIARHQRTPQRQPRGWVFGLGIRSGERVVGVSTACRSDDERTIEIGSTGKSLYLATWRAAAAMGFRRGIARPADVDGAAALLDAGWVEVRDGLWEIRAAA